MRPGRPGLIAPALLCTLALASACASGRALPPPPAGLPERAAVAGVPFHAQRTDQCGPAALAMVLAWSGLEVDPDELVREVYLPGRGGTTQLALISSARRRGRLAVPLAGPQALLGELAAGRPVLVLQDLGLLWYRAWHYAVVIGYNLERRTIRLHTGGDAARSFPLSYFLRSWSASGEWGLVVLVPGELPVADDERAYLQAAVGLERAGRSGQAARAYGAATTRWPGSLGAWIGLGNSRYAEGELVAAERAFRRATELQPDAAIAWNNLALVLSERGRKDEALAAALRAVEIGGPQAESFEDTLRGVQAGHP